MAQKLDALAHAGATPRVDANFLGPNPLRLVIFLVNGHPKPFFGDTQGNRNEVPCVMDCLTLEVIAEAEIPEHFEESVMSGRVTDVFEIVVLAPRPHAALRRGRSGEVPYVFAQKNVFELHHACVGEQ